MAMKIWAWAVAGVLFATGCDKEEPKPTAAQAPPAATTSSAPAAPPPPAAPRPPAIMVDDTGATVDGEPFGGAPAEWRDRLGAMLATRPLVTGQTVTVSAVRDAKAPKVLAVVAALRHAKATGVIIETPTREQTMGHLEIALAHGPVADCSAAGMIEKDGSVAVWGVGGGTAQRFHRGLAGPDLTLGVKALKDRAGGCDSAAWILGADDTVTWGLTFDLAMRAKAVVDGGTALRPTTVLLATTAPVPGRRVTVE